MCPGFQDFTCCGFCSWFNPLFKLGAKSGRNGFQANPQIRDIEPIVTYNKIV